MVPTTQIVKLSDEEYSLNTILPFMTHSQKFVPGREIEQWTVDGRKVKNIFVFEGNKLIERQIEPSREALVIRHFNDKEMWAQATVGSVTNKQFYKLIE